MTRVSRRGFLVGGAAIAAGCAHTFEQGELAELEQALGGRIGLSALDTGTGRRIDWRAGERFAMCSTFKAALAAAVLQRVDARELGAEHVLIFDAANVLPTSRVTAERRDGRIRVIEACEAVVVVSDNTAASALLELLGGPPAMTAFFRRRTAELESARACLRPGRSRTSQARARTAPSTTSALRGHPALPRSS